MAVCTGYDMYRNNHYEGMDPKRLILLLYDGALKFLRLTREGIEENDIRKRGENLGRVIAIVSELNASLDVTIQDESVTFLSGLYAAILTELPKVSLNNDVEIVNRSYAYIAKLKEIWEKDVMGLAERKKGADSTAAPRPDKQPASGATFSNRAVQGYQSYSGKSTSISV